MRRVICGIAEEVHTVAQLAKTGALYVFRESAVSWLNILNR
jgi:hypothetical protein